MHPALHRLTAWIAPAEPFEGRVARVVDVRRRGSADADGPIIRIKDEVEKKRGTAGGRSGLSARVGAAVERQIGAGLYLAGAKLCVADLKLFVAVGAYLKGTIRLHSTDVFGAFPALRLVEAVKQHPRVVDWYARK